MHFKPNILQEKKARRNARLFRERKHSSYMGEDFFFCSLPTLFGSGYLNYNHPMYDIFIKKGQQKRGKEYGTDGYSDTAA